MAQVDDTGTNKDESGQMEVCTALSRNFEKSIKQSSQCSFLVLTSLTLLKSRDQFIAEEGALLDHLSAVAVRFAIISRAAAFHSV